MTDYRENGFKAAKSLGHDLICVYSTRDHMTMHRCVNCGCVLCGSFISFQNRVFSVYDGHSCAELCIEDVIK